MAVPKRVSLKYHQVLYFLVVTDYPCMVINMVAFQNFKFNPFFITV